MAGHTGDAHFLNGADKDLAEAGHYPGFPVPGSHVGVGTGGQIGQIQYRAQKQLDAHGTGFPSEGFRRSP